MVEKLGKSLLAKERVDWTNQNKAKLMSGKGGFGIVITYTFNTIVND